MNYMYGALFIYWLVTTAILMYVLFKDLWKDSKSEMIKWSSITIHRRMELLIGIVFMSICLVVISIILAWLIIPIYLLFDLYSLFSKEEEVKI